LHTEDELIDGKEVCRIAKIKMATLYGWVYLGKIDCVKVGNLNRYRKSYILKRFGLLDQESSHEIE
jgi:hypothetical protein